MKKIIALVLFMMVLIKTSAQGTHTITGLWYNATRQGKIEIFKSGNEYCGKLVWLKQPFDAAGKPYRDKMNIRPELRSRTVLGLVLIKGLTYNGLGYDGGTVYDPRSGKQYSCIVSVYHDKLAVKAYMGMFLVHQELWSRVK